MIHAFPICVVHISLGPFSENERAGRMAEGKVEDKRFLARPVAFFLLSLSHPIVDRRADPSFNPSLKRPPRKNWYKLGVKYQRKVIQAGGQI